MLTELQQTLELTSHAMVRDPKLLVRVHEHGYTGPVWKSTFPTINPHSTEPKTPATWRHPRAFGDALYSIGPSNIPSPSLPCRPCPEQHQTPTETFQPRYLPPLRCSSAIPLSQESPRSKRILLDGGELELLPPIQLEIGISAKGTVEAVRWTGHSRNQTLFSTFHQGGHPIHQTAPIYPPEAGRI